MLSNINMARNMLIMARSEMQNNPSYEKALKLQLAQREFQHFLRVNVIRRETNGQLVMA